jgi:hypothetical protein
VYDRPLFILQQMQAPGPYDILSKQFIDSNLEGSWRLELNIRVCFKLKGCDWPKLIATNHMWALVGKVAAMQLECIGVGFNQVRGRLIQAVFRCSGLVSDMILMHNTARVHSEESYEAVVPRL